MSSVPAGDDVLEPDEPVYDLPRVAELLRLPVTRVHQHLRDGHLLAVHWRHPVADYPRSGDEVHGALSRRDALAPLASHTELDFVAQVFIRTRREPVSVAQAEGLV